jgi:hypothetical protein
MTIRTEINGNPCIVTMPDPGGQTRIRGRVWRWEYVHGMFGLLRKDGEPMSMSAWPGEKHPLWRAIRRWEKKNGKAKQISTTQTK